MGSEWMILAIFFWVCVALATIALMCLVYIQLVYFFWERERYEKEMQEIEETGKIIVDSDNSSE